MNVEPTPSHFNGRVEDEPLLRGRGRYVADAPLPDQAYAVFVRSPHAFADIISIETSNALRAPGVLAVLTGADLDAANIGDLSQHPPFKGRNGTPLVVPRRSALPSRTVRHVGEPVAVVVAETMASAEDAAELVEVAYNAHAATVDIREAVKTNAPQIWPEAPGNIAVDWPGTPPDPDTNARDVDAVFASAKHVARVSLLHQRLVVASMEPRGATASYDPKTDSYLLRSCSQGARVLRDRMAQIMGVSNERMRVITEDVGGAFGLKTGPYPEYPAILLAARTIDRPVHWMSSRSEAFLSDNMGRDGVSDVELALDERGKFVALRIRHLANMGAYIGPVGAFIQTVSVAWCLPGMYDIAKIDISARCVFTNTALTAPYRGAGRPEANYMLERAVDEASRITGIDPIKLRRRNLIPAKAIPYKTAVGTTYDSGDFPTVFDKAIALSDWNGFRHRRRDAARRGKWRGMGMSCVLEWSGGYPIEGSNLHFPGGETLLLDLNVQSTGQGHATAFGGILAERLGIPPRHIEHRHGDSAMEIPGYASVGSRSAQTVTHAIVETVDLMLAKGKVIASQILEAAETDIEYAAGQFVVAGTDRMISLFELADRARQMRDRGDIAETLDTKGSAETVSTFPNGCHVAEVEIDPATGELTLISYTAVDDCGRALNHAIVEGQTHGALVQGLGQAMMERTIYDLADGQLTTGSFMDYAMPRASDMPSFRDAMHNVPATTNPLGVKGVGEAGTTGAIATLMNAIADAIPGQAGACIDMPATPERLWRACRAAQEARRDAKRPNE